MNNPANINNSQGLLKKSYIGHKGPVAQMSESMPMLKAIRAKRDMLRTR